MAALWEPHWGVRGSKRVTAFARMPLLRATSSSFSSERPVPKLDRITGIQRRLSWHFYLVS